MSLMLVIIGFWGFGGGGGGGFMCWIDVVLVLFGRLKLEVLNMFGRFVPAGAPLIVISTLYLRIYTFGLPVED